MGSPTWPRPGMRPVGSSVLHEVFVSIPGEGDNAAYVIAPSRFSAPPGLEWGPKTILIPKERPDKLI